MVCVKTLLAEARAEGLVYGKQEGPLSTGCESLIIEQNGPFINVRKYRQFVLFPQITVSLNSSWFK